MTTRRSSLFSPRAWLAFLRGRMKRKPLSDRARTGLWGEHEAARWLQGRGLKILGQRVRLGPRDELDLIARDGEVLVFVEVKTRSATARLRPASAVGPAKQRALSRAALRYLARRRIAPCPFRFDIVEVSGHPGDAEPPLIRHLPAAFTLHRAYRAPW